MTRNTQITETMPTSADGSQFHWLRKMILAIAVVQLLYWFMFYIPLFKQESRRNYLPFDSAQIAKLDEPTWAALNQAKLEKVDLPWYSCCDTGYYGARIVFKLDAVPPTGLAYLPMAEADNSMVAVNGHVVYAEGRMWLPNNTYHNNLKQIVRISPGLLRAGANHLELILVRNSHQYFDVFPPLLGEYNSTRHAVRKRDYSMHEYQTQAITIGFVLSLLTLILVLRSTPRHFAVWMFLLLASTTMYSHFFHWPDPWFQGQNRLLYYFSLTLFVPFAWLNFSNEWTGKPMPWLRFASGIAFGLCWTVAAFQLHFRTNTGFDFVSEWANRFGLVMGAATIARLLWHFWRERDERHWEVALFVLCTSLLAMEWISQWLWNATTAQVQNSVPFLMVAFAVAFLSRNIHLFKSMNEINAILTGKLQEREAELATQYARQSELLQRETVVQERHRIMRDMHDGIGGQLMSLLHASRNRGLPSAELNESLEAITLELRLIIDSLDTVGTSLSMALGTFRSRLDPKLKAAGIELVWNNQLDDEDAPFGPHAILQILRIVQEAVTNAIKHANSPRIHLSAVTDLAAAVVRLQVRDEGNHANLLDESGKISGENFSGGRGMKSMQERAHSIGANINMQTTAQGTTVDLVIPLTNTERLSQSS